MPIGDVTGEGITRVVGVVLASVGVALALAGVFRFRALGTTINPAGQASSLATGGIYAHTRNPMYLGWAIGFLGLV